MKSIFLLWLFTALVLPTRTPTANAIEGQWLNPQKDARFLIYKKQDRYFGKVVWGTGERLDVKNPNPALRKRDLQSFDLLQNFRFDDGSWVDGTIYDPREGKTYSCVLKLKSATQLEVRGYVGIPLFGRSEIWTKTTNP